MQHSSGPYIKPFDEERVSLLGLQLTPLTLSQAVSTCMSFVEKNKRCTVTFPNVYCISYGRNHPDYLEAINSADLILADGMPLVWASRLLGRHLPGRVCAPEVYSLLNERIAESGHRVFFVGGGHNNAERNAAIFKSMYPNLNVVGTYSPPYGPIHEETTTRILKMVADAKPDILWVALGSPREEYWLWRNKNRIEASVSLGVGISFHYATGVVRRAPQWMCNIGLEWSYRLIQDPSIFIKKKYYTYVTDFLMPLASEIFNPSKSKLGEKS